MMQSSYRVAVLAYTAFVFALFLCVAVIMLSGCATTAVTSAGAQRQVYIAESDFEVAVRIAVTYEALPTCSATQKFPCSDPATVSKVTAAANAARASLATAQAAVQSTNNEQAIVAAASEAEADVSAFTTLANALGVK